MSYSIIPTHRFEKELKRLVKKFSSLKANPETGTFLGNNCYKIRFAIRSKGKGKSSGVRVINYFYRGNGLYADYL